MINRKRFFSMIIGAPIAAIAKGNDFEEWDSPNFKGRIFYQRNSDHTWSVYDYKLRLLYRTNHKMDLVPRADDPEERADLFFSLITRKHYASRLKSNGAYVFSEKLTADEWGRIQRGDLKYLPKNILDR